MIKQIENVRYITKEHFLDDTKMKIFIAGVIADIRLGDESLIEVYVETNRLLSKEEIKVLVNKEVENIKGCETLREEMKCKDKQIEDLNKKLKTIFLENYSREEIGKYLDIMKDTKIPSRKEINKICSELNRINF